MTDDSNIKRTMSLSGKNVLITGASMGIGSAIAHELASKSATLVCCSRSYDKWDKLRSELQAIPQAGPIHLLAVDVGVYTQVRDEVQEIVKQLGRPIDILINNVGLALAASKTFPEQDIADISTMVSTNINGFINVSHSVWNEGGMLAAKRDQVINITSVTALECPPFSGEATLHTCKAAQEAFTNTMRNELKDTDIKMLAIWPGVVATNFHEQRVEYDQEMYQESVDGYEPLLAADIAETVAWVLEKPDRVSVKALYIVSTAQRSLMVFDRKWSERWSNRT